LTALIETALICAPSRAHETIFGRPLLERLMLLCSRVGVRRFIVEASPSASETIGAALGSYRTNPQVTIVDSISAAGNWRDGMDLSAPCLAFRGNLVMAQSQLRRALADYAQNPSRDLHVVSADADRGGSIEVGSLDAILQGRGNASHAIIQAAAGYLPFALNGRPEDRQEAELRLAKSVRAESLETDAVLARIFDRRLSWRLSYRLARTRVMPNHVTLANTALGFGCAAMLASTGYWMRLLGAVLFLISVTLDGVDGELARLRMVESEAGAKLDVLTDNIVHIAIFIGLTAGCYRSSHSPAYFYLLAILLGGFGLCAISVNRALKLTGARAHEWIGAVERATGRDFAYLLVILALFGWLPAFVWAAAFGSWVFALSLWWLTNERREKADARV
jgi:phosphatidylglycerophosphate synthase